ncbi:Branched-chain alpha-keto acid dehydrogenase, E1 component, alpha subunit, partial [hydrothermal vent metagenome]
MTLGLDSVMDHTALGLSDEDLLDLYRKMLLARRLDERMWALNRQGRVPFVVSVSGHEATQVGAAAAIDPSKDWSMPYYRDLAFALAIGITPEQVFAGVFAKEMDTSSGGRQLPNHWSEPKLNVFT